MVKENLQDVEERIIKACVKAKRERSEVTLIAVSKTKPIKMIEEAMETGIIEFGENKVQELSQKYEELPKSLHWHLIGHLQTNKVKQIIDKVHLIHSVDSFRLAQTISQEAIKKNVEVSILIEVNVAQEESKFGVSVKDTLGLVEEIAKLPNIYIKGLMTIAPFVENAEDNRETFRKLKKLSVDIKTKNIDNVTMKVLSMGMTGDYEVAIEEGATLVRVGTGIFGERNYNI
ncbi:MAG: YggS family pyridoxal phosphate-dependent enzyme [Lachnotalea sp.]